MSSFGIMFRENFSYFIADFNSIPILFVLASKKGSTSSTVQLTQQYHDIFHVH